MHRILTFSIGLSN